MMDAPTEVEIQESKRQHELRMLDIICRTVLVVALFVLVGIFVSIGDMAAKLVSDVGGIILLIGVAGIASIIWCNQTTIRTTETVTESDDDDTEEEEEECWEVLEKWDPKPLCASCKAEADYFANQ